MDKRKRKIKLGLKHVTIEKKNVSKCDQNLKEFNSTISLKLLLNKHNAIAASFEKRCGGRIIKQYASRFFRSFNANPSFLFRYQIS